MIQIGPLTNLLRGFSFSFGTSLTLSVYLKPLLELLHLSVTTETVTGHSEHHWVVF